MIDPKPILDIFSKPAIWAALRAVCDTPQCELRVEKKFVDLGMAHALDATLLGASVMEPGAIATTEHMRHFVRHGQKWRFIKVFDRQILRCDNNVANAFVARFVRTAIRRLKKIAANIQTSGIPCNADAEISDIHGMRLEILHAIQKLNAIFDSLPPGFKYAELREMPYAHPLLQFDPHYRAIMQAYLALEHLPLSSK